MPLQQSIIGFRKIHLFRNSRKFIINRDNFNRSNLTSDPIPPLGFPPPSNEILFDTVNEGKKSMKFTASLETSRQIGSL